MTVTGWATQWDVLDPSRATHDDGPVQIAVLLDGEWAKGLFPAEDLRRDVDRYMVSRFLWYLRQPAMGYGFDMTVPADRRETGVCVSALNQNLDVFGEVGDHVLLGCRSVTVS